MSERYYYVIAKVAGASGSMSKWKGILEHLCAVSKTEQYGSSYYWGQDLDGEPDTLWGLEGYTHAIGFFLGHPSSDIFKEQMVLVDQDKLLKTRQGIDSPDYDLHHYTHEAGWLKHPNDGEKDAKTSQVKVIHYWGKEGSRQEIMQRLAVFADELYSTSTPAVQSCLVLKDLLDPNLTTIWLRTKTNEQYQSLLASPVYRKLQQDIGRMVATSEIHNSVAFNGHLQKDLI